MYMSTAATEPAACNNADEAGRLNVLESQIRELADKTQTQERGALENKRRLEDLAREAEKHKTEIVGMLAKVRESNTEEEEGKEISSGRTRDAQPPEAPSERENEETAGNLC